MIDTKELRSMVNGAQFESFANSVINSLLDRIEAAEKERSELSALVVMRFDHDYPPQFTQGHDSHELTEPVTAEHCRWFVAEIQRLRTDCDALRAKVEAMEKQEPVAWQSRSRPTWNDGTWSEWSKCSEEYAQDIKKTPLLHDWLYEARALYALPGAQNVPSVPTDVITDYLVSISAHLAHQDDRKAQAEIGELLKMLAAAPEAKP